MDQDCVAYDGYCVYHISSYHRNGVRFLIDQGTLEPNRIIIPLFKIANGQVRTYSWDGDTSGEEPGSDYECLKENIEAAKAAIKEFNYPIQTTIVITTDDGHYGIGIVPGIVIGRVKEEVIPLHC